MSNVKNIILCLSLALSLSSCEDSNSEVKVELGKKAPSFEIKLLNNEMLTPSLLKGEYVLIDFWASWCGPCIREMPELMHFSETFKKKTLDNGKSLKILSVALEKKAGASTRVSQRFGFDWDWQAEEATRFVRFSDIASKFEVTDIPSTFLISPNGSFLSINRSYHEMEVLLNNRLQ